MRAESDLDDDDQADEFDDTRCTSQKPKRRCCIVWHQVGAYTVLACSHCPRVKKSYESEPGDAERIRRSRQSHEDRCERQFWSIPEPRMPRRATATAASASPRPSMSGR